MAQHMKAWQCPAPGPITKTLKLVDDAPRPTQPLRDGQILVNVACAAINPVDYKLLGFGVASRAISSFPKTPGLDMSGTVAAVAEGTDGVKPGDLVVVRLEPFGREGGLSQSVVANRDQYAVLPAGFDLEQAAGVGTAGLTAYQTLAPYVSPGDQVFVNGGGGGVGFFHIQIAKALGCRITVTCSTEKVDLCRELGADDIIDYKKSNVLEELSRRGQVFRAAVDNVSTSPPNLYAESHHFLLPDGHFSLVGGAVSTSNVLSLSRSLMLPAFLGGGKRPFSVFMTKNNPQHLAQIAQWMGEGKVKTVIDKVFEFEDAPKAYELLQKGSAVGKIIVRVSSE